MYLGVRRLGAVLGSKEWADERMSEFANLRICRWADGREGEKRPRVYIYPVTYSGHARRSVRVTLMPAWAYLRISRLRFPGTCPVGNKT